MLCAAQPWLLHMQASYNSIYANGRSYDKLHDNSVNHELLQMVLGMDWQPRRPIQPAPPLFVLSLQLDRRIKPRSHSAPQSYAGIQDIPAPEDHHESRSRSAPPNQPSLEGNLQSHQDPRLLIRGDVLPRDHPLLQDHPEPLFPSSDFSLPSERFQTSDMNFPSVSDIVDPSTSQNTSITCVRPTPPGAQIDPKQDVLVSSRQSGGADHGLRQPGRLAHPPPQMRYGGGGSRPTPLDVEDPAAAPREGF